MLPIEVEAVETILFVFALTRATTDEEALLTAVLVLLLTLVVIPDVSESVFALTSATTAAVANNHDSKT